MMNTLKKTWQAQVAILFFILITIWWFVAPLLKKTPDERFLGDPGSIYFFIAIWGAIWGVQIAFKWGGLKSLMGKALLFFTLGLGGQIFGQFSYGYYPFILHQEVPYPSIGDIGYFSSIPFYIMGIYFLARASGVTIGIRSFSAKIQAIVIPLVILLSGYFFFLRGYQYDWSKPGIVFLEVFGPLGQAFYISLAILTYLLSKGSLGGIMKNKVLFILGALAVQFLSDYTFLYQASRNVWFVGGLNDYMYFTAYFLMTLALLQFKTIHDRLRSK